MSSADARPETHDCATMVAEAASVHRYPLALSLSSRMTKALHGWIENPEEEEPTLIICLPGTKWLAWSRMEMCRYS